MRKYFSFFLILCIVFFFTLTSTAVTRQWPPKIGVSPDHVWTVVFSNPVDESTLAQNILIRDGRDNIYTRYSVTTENNGKHIRITPNTTWEQGMTYTLFVRDIKDVWGNSLLFGVSMRFTILKSGQHRIELEWGELPYDLDLQLYVRTSQKQYHFIHATNRQTLGIAYMDVDVVTGFGVETMVVEPIVSSSLYTVVVAQNTYEIPLSDSEATVRIYDINGLVMERNIPTQLRPDLWGVVQWRNGNLVPIEISY